MDTTKNFKRKRKHPVKKQMFIPLACNLLWRVTSGQGRGRLFPLTLRREERYYFRRETTLVTSHWQHVAWSIYLHPSISTDYRKKTGRRIDSRCGFSSLWYHPTGGALNPQSHLTCFQKRARAKLLSRSRKNVALYRN